jgi:integrase
MARRGWGSIVARDGKYYGRFSLDGSPTMRLLKRADARPCATLAQAERALGALRKSVEHGATAPQRAPMKFRDWCKKEYLPRIALAISPTSLRSAGSHLERLAVWIEANDVPKTMDGFHPKHADKFVQYLLHDERLKPSYADRLVRTLRTAWRDAEKHGIVDDGRTWDEVKIRVGEQTEVPWIAPAQLAKLYEQTNVEQRPLVVLLGETGLRIGEALALRWGDVEHGNRPAVFVREGKTRAARRKVPLSPRAAAALEALGRGAADALVFTPRTTQGVREAIRRACRRAGLPLLKTHALRHVAASHLVQAGVPAPTVASLLGHADHGVLVTRLYGRWIPNEAGAAAMDRLAAWRGTETPKDRPASAGRSRAGSTSRGKPSVPAARRATATTVEGS